MRPPRKSARAVNSGRPDLSRPLGDLLPPAAEAPGTLQPVWGEPPRADPVRRDAWEALPAGLRQVLQAGLDAGPRLQGGAAYDSDELRHDLGFYEGARDRPYRDTAGKLTVGVGHNLGVDPELLARRAEFERDGMSRAEMERVLERDIESAVRGLDRRLPWWRELSPRRVMVNLAFNMGTDKLVKFEKSLGAMQAGDFETAADELLNSRWANQVGVRRFRPMIEQMRTGQRVIPTEPTQ